MRLATGFGGFGGRPDEDGTGVDGDVIVELAEFGFEPHVHFADGDGIGDSMTSRIVTGDGLAEFGVEPHVHFADGIGDRVTVLVAVGDGLAELRIAEPSHVINV